MTAISTANGNPHTSERATTSATPAPAPASPTAKSTAPSSTGCSKDSATPASTTQNSEPTPARAACNGLARRRYVTAPRPPSAERSARRSLRVGPHRQRQRHLPAVLDRDG